VMMMERRWFFPAVAGSVFSAIVGSADGGGMAEVPVTAAVFFFFFCCLRGRRSLFSSSSSAGWEEGDELSRDGGGVWQCWCSWRVTAAAPPLGVAVAAGMEEKMRSVWGSVDREGCFGCREEMAERGEWPGGGLFLGALSFSRSKNTPPLLVFQPSPVQQNSPRFKLLPLSVSKSFSPS